HARDRERRHRRSNNAVADHAARPRRLLQGDRPAAHARPARPRAVRPSGRRRGRRARDGYERHARVRAECQPSRSATPTSITRRRVRARRSCSCRGWSARARSSSRRCRSSRVTSARSCTTIAAPAAARIRASGTRSSRWPTTRCGSWTRWASTPRWVSENDECITELHRVAAAGYPPVEIVASRIDAILGHDRRRRLLQIRVPTLVIVARDDMITPSFYSEELASAIPGAKLVVLDGGGHFAPAIHATPYNAAVGAFLRALR